MHAVGTQAAPAYEGVASYAEALAALEEGLHAVEQTFTGLSLSEWQRTTVLDPLDAALPRWDVLTLAAHFDISIGLTLALLASAQEGQVGRDQVSFFIFDRNQVAPVVYQYALDVVKGHTPGTMMTKVRQTFASTLEAARSTPPETIGSGYYALMRLDEFVASRVVEAVVHGMDLTDALGRPPLEMPRATAITAAILDALLARRTVAGRPEDLKTDNLAFIRAASGRGPHPDPRFPLIG
jgi:hypothetical protein